MKPKYIITIIITVVIIASLVLVFYFLNKKEKNDDNKIIIKNDYYNCETESKDYKEKINNSIEEVSYSLIKKYSFIVSEKNISNGNVTNIYQFENEDEYNKFQEYKNTTTKFTEKSDKDNLNVTYSAFIIIANSDNEKKEFDSKYLTYLEDMGYKCIKE